MHKVLYDPKCYLLKIRFFMYFFFCIYALLTLDLKHKLTWNSIALVRSNSIKTQFIFGASISFINALVDVDTISCLMTIISSITDITDTYWLITEMSLSDTVSVAGPAT